MIVVVVAAVVARAPLPAAVGLLQHALEARGHMRRRPMAYEVIPVLGADWIGGFTSPINVILSMVQDSHNHAHPLPLAPSASLKLPPGLVWSTPASTPHARRIPNPGISPPTLAQKSSAHAPPQAAPKSLLVLARLCRFLEPTTCLPSCVVHRASLPRAVALLLSSARRGDHARLAHVRLCADADAAVSSIRVS